MTHDSQLSVLKLGDTAGTLRDVSANVVSITPRFGRHMSEATTLGKSHETVHPGIDLTSLDVEFVYNETAATGTDTVLGALLSHTTAREYEYWPVGLTGHKYAGTCFVENYQPVTRVRNIVTATATLRAITRARTT